MIRSICLALLSLALLPATGPAAPLATYQCTVDINGNTTDCLNGIVTVTASSGAQRVARIDLGGFVRLDLFVDVCNPARNWIHLSDSPTNDGGGRDTGTTEHDAEAYFTGTFLDMYSTYNAARAAFEEIYQSGSGLVAASGCSRVQWTIFESRLLYDDDANPADAPRLELRSQYGFESPPYNEPDAEDPTGADAGRWYVGLNRLVGGNLTSGSGVTKACFVLSSTTNPSPSTLSALCP